MLREPAADGRLDHAAEEHFFSQSGQWKGIYMSEYYDVPLSKDLPAEDKVVIYPVEDNGTKNSALAMRLSKTCAENNGLAALSERVDIAPEVSGRITAIGSRKNCKRAARTCVGRAFRSNSN